MPTYLKLIISLLVLLLGWGLLEFGDTESDSLLIWIVPTLALIMILAIWLFPEARKLPAGK